MIHWRITTTLSSHFFASAQCLGETQILESANISNIPFSLSPLHLVGSFPYPFPSDTGWSDHILHLSHRETVRSGEEQSTSRRKNTGKRWTVDRDKFFSTCFCNFVNYISWVLVTVGSINSPPGWFCSRCSIRCTYIQIFILYCIILPSLKGIPIGSRAPEIKRQGKLGLQPSDHSTFR